MGRAELVSKFLAVRNLTEKLCEPLAIEDYVVQTSYDVSPPKWHLGHTSWFFERMLLQEFEINFSLYHELYYFLFNSYYQSLSKFYDRKSRGTLSRPTVKEIMDYRKTITERSVNLVETLPDEKYQQFEEIMIVGINHEQQHQELLLTDIKHIFATNPLAPVYCKKEQTKSAELQQHFIPFKGGLFEIGAVSDGFAYDNEFPRHQVYLNDFKLSNRLSTCGDFLEFMTDKGYQEPLLWLSDGWDIIQNENWQVPLYWEKIDGEWFIHTLSGRKLLDNNEPICHLSHFEAMAYARWAGKRLPTEQEWEVAVQSDSQWNDRGLLLDDGNYHPLAENYSDMETKLSSMIGNVWEWTNSAYLPYPGYLQTHDPLGEYNDKFMSNQMVLKGGSCVTPADHIRASYRNFFQSEKRWQFSGFRLAEDA